MFAAFWFRNYFPLYRMHEWQPEAEFRFCEWC